MSDAGTIMFQLPTALREFAQGQENVNVHGQSVGEALQALAAEHPLVGSRIIGPGGELRRHVNLFLGERNVRDLQGLDTRVAAGDTIFIIPAVAGG
ncbi:MAG: MoaD/ThiS family protein [Gammaproteobacteria bacterium]|jgi:molybdopterin converting factor small subunit|nr:MoaD/ThiS family protein [Gammaproteobacteria bacterium]